VFIKFPAETKIPDLNLRAL